MLRPLQSLNRALVVPLLIAGTLRAVRKTMNAKKRKTKERRRARKLADQAWDAVDVDNLDLAEKLIRRAVATQIDNPVLWHDQGMILCLRGNELEAEQAFRATLSLAPDFADAYAQLAAIHSRRSQLADAVALQQQAVTHAPENSEYRKRLESYRSLVGQVDTQLLVKSGSSLRIETEPRDRGFDELLASRLAEIDWSKLEGELTRNGCILVPRLMDAATCEMSREWFDDDALFAKTVVMDRPQFGCGVYRYFRAPMPDLLDVLRRAVYEYVAPIANRWTELLHECSRFPDDWNEFRDECHRAGQSTPTPILLKYEAGGFNALHRDLRGDVYFPIQLAIILSECADPSDPKLAGFHGGDFLFADSPERKKSRCRSIRAGLGDAILFCTRDRLISIGGAYGLQAVKHGVSQITSGNRLVLGLPFHEYR